MDISGANLDFSDICFDDLDKQSTTFQHTVSVFTTNAEYSQIAYMAKFCLHNSIIRTFNGFTRIRKFEVLSGSMNILLARIESLLALVLLSFGVFFYSIQLILVDFSLIPTLAFNLCSRASWFSSYKSVEILRKNTNEFIYRALRVNLIVIPVLILFSTSGFINTFLPGSLTPDNPLFVSIDLLVKPLGPLKNFTATIPNKRCVTGTKGQMSISETLEEFLRCLSFTNYLRKIETNYIYHSYINYYHC